MPTQVVVPDLGESVMEATIARWIKREGEAVAAGEAFISLLKRSLPWQRLCHARGGADGKEPGRRDWHARRGVDRFLDKAAAVVANDGRGYRLQS